jgi:hypothetical protein
METICSTKTSAKLYQTTWRHIPEGGILHIHRLKNLKSHILTITTIIIIGSPAPCLGLCLPVPLFFPGVYHPHTCPIIISSYDMPCI